MSGGHRRKRTTTDQQYTAMLRRLIRAWGRRAGEDIEANLAQLRALEAELTDAANVAIWRANRHGGVSINRIAASLRVSKQAASKRVKAGEQIARRDARLTMRLAQPRELPPGRTSNT